MRRSVTTKTWFGGIIAAASGLIAAGIAIALMLA